MKVLDPQSALLTNAEVYQFLQSNTPRKAETQIGSYPVTNLIGYTAVRRDVSGDQNSIKSDFQQSFPRG